MPAISQPQVVVIWQGNRRREGTVISSANYGTKSVPNWYIEFTCYSDTYAYGTMKPHYVYYKQGPDGGQVSFLVAPESSA